MSEIIDLSDFDYSYCHEGNKIRNDDQLLKTNQADLIFNSHLELVDLRKKLSLIQHAKKCSNALCRIENCIKFQQITKFHVPNCDAQRNLFCNSSSCKSTRKLLKHEADCEKNNCVLCANLPNVDANYDRHLESPTPLPWQNLAENKTSQMNLNVVRPWLVDQQPYRMLQDHVYPSPTSTMTSVAASANSTSNSRNCAKCNIHGLKVDIRRHKDMCPYVFCQCEKCKVITQSREIRSKRTADKRIRERMQNEYLKKFTPNGIESPLKHPKTIKDDLKVSEEESNDTVHENGNVWKKFDAKIIESALVYAGKDKEEHAIYVGRAYCGKQLLPAKLSIKHQLFTASINNFEYKLPNGEMLIDTGYLWKKVDDGVIPKNAVFGGLLSDGGNLFIGKAFHEETVLVGGVTVDGVLYASLNGKELSKSSFDILVRESGGKSSDSIAPLHQCSVCFEEAPIVGIFIECCHACLCYDCIALINEKRNKNGKVNCVICTRECYGAKKIHFA